MKERGSRKEMDASMISLIGSILVAIIGLIGTIITVKSGNDRIQSQLDKRQAVTDTKLDSVRDELRRVVNKSDSFTEKIPVMESRIDNHEERISKLEGGR